ncbi:hypothetical protein [Nioella sp.]|uniref:hypothetical protein n=1 Tax=Nioella sp. TaxID=1912091 RepID=UPI003A836656
MSYIYLFMALLLVSIPTATNAQQSLYTTIDFESGCRVLYQIEEGSSTSLLCEGLPDYPVYLADSDLRISMQFGQVDSERHFRQTFSAWNNINTTIEWRFISDTPVATIVRWFIDNVDPETGSTDTERRGQILVVSSVAPIGGGDSCMIGFVDAHENSDANVIARSIADNVAPAFNCTIDQPEYYGSVGPFAPHAPNIL